MARAGLYIEMGLRRWTSIRESGSYRFLTSLRDRSQSLLSSGDILCFNEPIQSTLERLVIFFIRHSADFKLRRRLRE